MPEDTAQAKSPPLLPDKAVTFMIAGRVQWRFCLEMAILAGLGGYLGAHYSRKVNQTVMRWAVAAIGFLTAGYFFMHK